MGNDNSEGIIRCWLKRSCLKWTKVLISLSQYRSRKLLESQRSIDENIDSHIDEISSHIWETGGNIDVGWRNCQDRETSRRRCGMMSGSVKPIGRNSISLSIRGVYLESILRSRHKSSQGGVGRSSRHGKVYSSGHWVQTLHTDSLGGNCVSIFSWNGP